MYLDEFKILFLNNPTNIIPPIHITYDIIEFKDGIYILSSDSFMKKEEFCTQIHAVERQTFNYLEQKNIKTPMYFSYNYKRYLKKE